MSLSSEEGSFYAGKDGPEKPVLTRGDARTLEVYFTLTTCVGGFPLSKYCPNEGV